MCLQQSDSVIVKVACWLLDGSRETTNTALILYSHALACLGLPKFDTTATTVIHTVTDFFAAEIPSSDFVAIRDCCGESILEALLVKSKVWKVGIMAAAHIGPRAEALHHGSVPAWMMPRPRICAVYTRLPVSRTARGPEIGIVSVVSDLGRECLTPSAILIHRLSRPCPPA